MTMDMLLIRHAESQANVGRSTDPNAALTDHGIGQARRLANLLAQEDLRHFAGIASPYRRATQTAAEIAGRTGLSFAVDAGVREWGPATEIDGAYYPRESVKQLTARLRDFLGRHAGRNLVVVSHAAPIAVLTQLAWGESPQTQGPFWEGIGNCSWRCLRATWNACQQATGPTPIPPGWNPAESALLRTSRTRATAAIDNGPCNS